ncbi:taspase, threonine aspartase, 1 [Saitoella coloradoensis]
MPVSAKACIAARDVLNGGGSALDAVTAAVTVLEDSKHTNAGYGSNLNAEGKVQMDAAVMDYSGCSAVAAVENVKNPVQLAQRLLKNRQNQLPYGRTRPNLLVGRSAAEWEHGVELVEPESLISPSAQEVWQKWKDVIEHGPFSPGDWADAGVSDTVGGIAMDSSGNLAAACSSGGIVHKHVGRVGPAAVAGSGLWVEDNVAVVCSGNGEEILDTILASKCASRLNCMEGGVYEEEAVKQVMERDFLGSSAVRRAKQNNRNAGQAGILALKITRDEGGSSLPIQAISVTWAHTTPSMHGLIVASVVASSACPEGKILKECALEVSE